MQKMFFEIMKQHQGEYMGSLLSAWLESMGPQLRSDADGSPTRLSKETMDAGLNNAVKDYDSQFPPEWRLSQSGRRRPGGRLTVADRSSPPLTGCASSTCRRGSPAPTAPGCSPTAAPRWSRSRRPAATRCAGGPPPGAAIAPGDDGALFNFLAATEAERGGRPGQRGVDRAAARAPQRAPGTP